MSAHTHDDIDWAAKLPVFRRSDRLQVARYRDVAARLADRLPRGATVADIGCGAGGMSAALAEVLAESAGTIVLVDAVPELLAEAEAAVRAAVGEAVSVRAVHADGTDDRLADLVGPADLVWAARVLHHLPDQQDGVRRLVRVLRPGGTLAIAEGGLRTTYLPWDLGTGEPGLGDRLEAARAEWFRRMRADMPGCVRMPYGWSTALAAAGLSDVSAFGVLDYHPAPPSPDVREYACADLGWISEVGAEWLAEDDLRAVRALLDPDGVDYLGARDDLFLLAATTIHHGHT